MPNDEIPDFMNNYFSNVGANLAERFVLQPDPNYIRDQNLFILPLFVTTELELLKLINNININKLSPIENISSRVMKEAFYVQLPRLVRIFNLSFSNGTVAYMQMTLCYICHYMVVISIIWCWVYKVTKIDIQAGVSKTTVQKFVMSVMYVMYVMLCM